MKTEVRNEFILEAHKIACSEWKLKIEKECPELFKSKLEVGKWYKTGNTLVFIDDIEREEYYGFFCGNWGTNWSFSKGSNMDICKPATEEEVKEALIKEAKKRGFKSGVKINRDMFTHNTGNVKISSNDNYDLFGLQNNLLQLGGYCIFENGKWAEICEEPKKITIQEIENILGYNIEIVK